ncbi:hypothetical protein ACJX0J_025627, partial [Zea mays]
TNGLYPVAEYYVLGTWLFLMCLEILSHNASSLVPAKKDNQQPLDQSSLRGKYTLAEPAVQLLGAFQYRELKWDTNISIKLLIFHLVSDIQVFKHIVNILYIQKLGGGVFICYGIPQQSDRSRYELLFDVIWLLPIH